MPRRSTSELLSLLNSVDSVEKLESFTQETGRVSPALSFHEYLIEHMERKGLKASELISLANIQRTYGYQILNGARNPGRNKVLALCLALSLPLKEVQRALTLAGESILYPKKRRDSILIFCINNRLSVQETNELLYEMDEPPLD